MAAAPLDPISPRQRRNRFWWAAVATAFALVALGWWSGLRAAFHAVLLALSVAAFLPLLVIVAFVVVFVGVSVVGILAGESDAAPHAAEAFAASEGLGAFVRRVLVPYYRLWFVRRHPVLLGVATGLLVGALALGGLLARWVVPGEVCTLKRMAALQDAIEEYHHHRAGYPAPVGDRGIDAGLAARASGGWPYCPAAADHRQGSVSVVADAFGRSLQYDISGTWPLVSYRLRSLGYDGRPSDDDLCLAGRTRARAAVDRLADAAGAIHDLLVDSPDDAHRDRWWSALRASSCPPATRSKD